MEVVVSLVDGSTGRADIVSTDGKVWEVKHNNQVAAEAQVQKYVHGTCKINNVTTIRC